MKNLKQTHEEAEKLAVAKQDAATRALAETYAQALTTPAGKLMLEDLAKKVRLFDSLRSNETESLQYLEGARSVVTRMLAMLKIASKDDAPTITLPL